MRPPAPASSGLVRGLSDQLLAGLIRAHQRVVRVLLVEDARLRVPMRGGRLRLPLSDQRLGLPVLPRQVPPRTQYYVALPRALADWWQLIHYCNRRPLELPNSGDVVNCAIDQIPYNV